MCLNPDKQRDRRLVRTAKRGHRARRNTPRQQAAQKAFTELEGVHGPCARPVIFKWLKGMRWNPEDREDAYQETWRRAQDKLPKLRQDSEFCEWGCGIARRVCLEMIARRLWEPLPEAGLQAPDNPETALIEAEFRALVRRYVDSLPEDLRTVIVLRFFEEMSWEEIETLLRLSHTELVDRRRNAALKMLWDNPEFRELAAAFDWIAELVCDLVCTVTAGAPQVTITFLVLRAAYITVSIYLSNRPVCRLAQHALQPAGPVSYAWNGQQTDGSMASAGLYRITVNATDQHRNEQKPELEHPVYWPAVGSPAPGGPDTSDRQGDTTMDTIPPAAVPERGSLMPRESLFMSEDNKFSTLPPERKRQLARQAVSQWRQEVQEVKKCRPVEDIVAFADGTLTPARLWPWLCVWRHLRHCTVCQVEVARVRRALAAETQPEPRRRQVPMRVPVTIGGLGVVLLGGILAGKAWHDTQLHRAVQEATAKVQQEAQLRLTEHEARTKAALHKAQRDLAVREAIIDSLSELAQLRQQMASTPAAVVEAVRQVHAVPLRAVAQGQTYSAPYVFVGEGPEHPETLAEGLLMAPELQAEYEAFLRHWATLFADLGDLLLQGGKVADALQVFAYLRQKNPAAKELLFALGELLKMSGQHEQAIKVYDDMIARGLAADDPRVWHFAGWSTLQLGPAHCQSALRYYDQALAIAHTRDPQRLYPKLFYNLADLYHSCDLPGLRAEERERLYQEHLQRALDLTLVAYQHEGDDNPRIPFTLAILYAKMGQLEQALEELERAVQKERIYRVRAAADPAFAVFRNDPTTPYHARFVALLDRYRPPALGGFGARLEATFDPTHFSE